MCSLHLKKTSNFPCSFFKSFYMKKISWLKELVSKCILVSKKECRFYERTLLKIIKRCKKEIMKFQEFQADYAVKGNV